MSPGERSRYASRSGSRLFLRPNLMNVWSTTPVEFPDRTQPIDMGFGFVDTDTIRYILPDGFVSESVPERMEIETDFGRYLVDYHMNAEERTLLFTRTLKYRQRRLPASRYDEWRDFIRHAVTADRAQVVLVRPDV